MNPALQQYAGEWRKTRLITFALYVLTPVAILIVAYAVSFRGEPKGSIDFLFYMLLAIAIVSPLVIPLIERFHVNNYRNTARKRMGPAQLFTALSIIKAAFVEQSYLYGLVMVILSADRTYLWYFYAIGIVWAAVYWPRRSKFEEFVQRMERNGRQP